MSADLAPIVAEIADGIVAEARAIERDADAKEEGLDPGPFGMAVATLDGGLHVGGEVAHRFPLQSIAKAFALDCALSAVGEKVFDRVGREPSGDPFNSIVELERNVGVPRNPFVNAGALVTVDVLLDALGGADGSGDDRVRRFVAEQLGRDDVALDDEVLASEQEGGDLNRAMLSFMRHHGNLRCDPDRVMSAYVEQCALSLDVRDLARVGLYLARTRRSDDEAIDARARQTRAVLALMMTCGHYDASGDFAVRVALPAKSGVGGGILAIVPERAAIAVWSPNLDQNGNSILGVEALARWAKRTGWSVFGPPLV